MRTIAAGLTALLFASAAMAQAPAPDMIQKFEKLQGSKLTGKSLSMVMVIGTLVGCTQKQAGKDQTQAFYTSIEKIGKNAEALCQQGKPAEARQLLLKTFAEKHTDPVMTALLHCYDSNATALEQMAGPEMAQRAANYARWVRDPQLAEKEIKTDDVCGKLSAKPKP